MTKKQIQFTNQKNKIISKILKINGKQKDNILFNSMEKELNNFINGQKYMKKFGKKIKLELQIRQIKKIFNGIKLNSFFSFTMSSLSFSNEFKIIHINNNFS